jgi:hypothetical protein
MFWFGMVPNQSLFEDALVVFAFFCREVCLGES